MMGLSWRRVAVGHTWFVMAAPFLGGVVVEIHGTSDSAAEGQTNVYVPGYRIKTPTEDGELTRLVKVGGFDECNPAPISFTEYENELPDSTGEGE